jgi:ADP-heptose:LPS heptosyltransferase
MATALVTNDSGPAHFASAVGLPTVVLFGPESPMLYAPLGVTSRALSAGFACSPCLTVANHRKTACCRARCLEAIELPDVIAALADLGVPGIAVRRPSDHS